MISRSIAERVPGARRKAESQAAVAFRWPVPASSGDQPKLSGGRFPPYQAKGSSMQHAQTEDPARVLNQCLGNMVPELAAV